MTDPVGKIPGGAEWSTVPPTAPEFHSASPLLAGRFRLGRELGRGGLGVVFEATDTERSEKVAVKFLRNDTASDGSVLDRLIHEVALVRKIDHPAICEIGRLASHEGRPFLTMQLLTGPDLSTWLEGRAAPLDMAETVKLLRPVAEALDAAHAVRVIHLDLKPGNLKFHRPPREGGKLRILDFGLARGRAEGVAGRRGRLGGSPAYGAPEQFRDAVPHPACDRYAFAVTAYELLAGTPPFVGEDIEAQKDRGRPPPLRGWGSRVDAVFARALHRKPSRRFPSAVAFLDALEGAARPRWGWWLAGALVVFGALALALR